MSPESDRVIGTVNVSSIIGQMFGVKVWAPLGSEDHCLGDVRLKCQVLLVLAVAKGL